MLAEKFIAFVRDLYNEPEAFLALHEPRFWGNEKKYLSECIDSTFVSSVGKYVSKLEDQVRDFTGAKHAVAASTGTAALHVALVLSGVSGEDEVITQPLTFVATANAIAYTGAKPVFIDVDKDTMGLSPQKLSAFLASHTTAAKNPRTNKLQPKNNATGRFITAVVPMHTFGHPARIEDLERICKQHNMCLVEDAAESLGSYVEGKHTGTFGDFGTLSFNGNKIITTGGGGMILTNDADLAAKAKHITTTAKAAHPWDYKHDMLGYNYRMTNLAAALGVAQMEQLDTFIDSQRELAKVYTKFFEQFDIDFVEERAGCKANYWLNTLVLSSRQERDAFLKKTNEAGVMTRPIWELMNRLEMYKACQTGDLSNAEWLADRVVNITSTVRVHEA